MRTRRCNTHKHMVQKPFLRHIECDSRGLFHISGLPAHDFEHESGAAKCPHNRCVLSIHILRRGTGSSSEVAVCPRSFSPPANNIVWRAVVLYHRRIWEYRGANYTNVCLCGDNSTYISRGKLYGGFLFSERVVWVFMGVVVFFLKNTKKIVRACLLTHEVGRGYMHGFRIIWHLPGTGESVNMIWWSSLYVSCVKSHTLLLLRETSQDAEIP